MSASAWTIDKVQRALALHLRAQAFDFVTSANIVYGMHRPLQANEDLERETKTLPWIACVCQTAEASALHSGEWLATATVALSCNTDDFTDDEFHAMCCSVMDALATTTIAADLTAVLADFTALHVNMQRQSWSIEGRKWTAELTMEIYCCGSDIPAT